MKPSGASGERRVAAVATRLPGSTARSFLSDRSVEVGEPKRRRLLAVGRRGRIAARCVAVQRGTGVRALVLAAAAFVAGLALADDSIELPGRVTGGDVDDSGVATLLLGDETSPFLVQVDDGGILGRVELPEGRRKWSMSELDEGRFLLTSFRDDDRRRVIQYHDIVEVKGSSLETAWSWNSRDDLLVNDIGSHPYEVKFSCDGRVWGVRGERGGLDFDVPPGATFFVLGETQDRASSFRVEHVEQTWHDPRWSDWLEGFSFLDSEGPVVLVRSDGGLHIIRFSEGASPVVRPILHGNGVDEQDFSWQPERRMLWVRTALYWKGFELPDLGLSGIVGAPVRVLRACRPYARETCPDVFGSPLGGGAVMEYARCDDGGWRMEVATRDQGTVAERRRASRCDEGEGANGLPWSMVITNADGSRVLVADHQGEGASKSTVRFLDFSHAPSRPPVEVDREAELEANRKFLGPFGLQ